MNFWHSIRTIYSKELVDILRDRRTLIAMIVVPIVLYPLLMLGSIQAVSYQVESLEEEQLVVGVVSQDQGRFLLELIAADAAALEAKLAESPVPSDESPVATQETPSIPGASSVAGSEAEPPRPISNVDVRALPSREALEQSARERTIHLGLIFEPAVMLRAPDQQVIVRPFFDSEDIRSSTAWYRINAMLGRTQDRVVAERLRASNLPSTAIEPFAVEVTDLANPASILGQILPLVLILMTITGAIYPAIDLTAGERERGTLETLMVCPVPVIDLVVGKFLVVTTVAIMGAALNLASVSATVYFGGFDVLVSQSGGGIPLGQMMLILLCLVPFAVLMSAIMIAVCSYARTFKEAQNYVTPVILAVLIPGGIAALPATQMEGIMLVMPVGNMVLLARDLLLGSVVSWWQVLVVLLSTTLYAGTAVAVATNVFGKESVVFADAASFRTACSRVLIKPSAAPTISMSLLLVSVLFPVWFFVQSAASPGPGEDATGLLYLSGLLMPTLFVAVPLVILLYWKVDVKNAFALRVPSASHLFAGMLLGLSAWVPAHELNVLQERVFGAPQAVIESAQILGEALAAMPVVTVILLIAFVPAVSEELLFRGFLLSGLRTLSRKWTAIVVSAGVFAVFHFFFFKFAVTAALGIVLAYLCWQSRSILPGMVAHFLHNALGALTVIAPTWPQRLGINPTDDNAWAHLPLHILVIGGMVFVTGLICARRSTNTGEEPELATAAAG